MSGPAAAVLAELKTSALVAAAVAAALGEERAATPAEALAVDPQRAAVLRSLPDAEALLEELWAERRSRAHHLVSSLTQAATAARGATGTWADSSDEVIVAQGRSSALMARVMLNDIAPLYGALASGSESRMLDVGTGIGAIATAIARAVPDARVVGIDIAERPLELGAELLAEEDAAVAGRVELRLQDVTAIDEAAAYDVVWMPMPFLPDAIAAPALDRATAALREGGLLVLGAHPDEPDPRVKAANDWLASLTGGGTLAASAVIEELERRGFDRVERFATVPGGPIVVAGVRPA